MTISRRVALAGAAALIVSAALPIAPDEDKTPLAADLFAEFAAGGDYDPSIWLTISLGRYPADVVADVPAVSLRLCVEAGRYEATRTCALVHGLAASTVSMRPETRGSICVTQPGVWTRWRCHGRCSPASRSWPF